MKLTKIMMAVAALIILAGIAFNPVGWMEASSKATQTIAQTANALFPSQQQWVEREAARIEQVPGTNHFWCDQAIGLAREGRFVEARRCLHDAEIWRYDPNKVNKGWGQ
jgi:hypothetical protein